MPYRLFLTIVAYLTLLLPLAGSGAGRAGLAGKAVCEGDAKIGMPISTVETGHALSLQAVADAAAIEVSQYTSKPFLASHGWVDIYPDGRIDSQNPFYRYEGGLRGNEPIREAHIGEKTGAVRMGGPPTPASPQDNPKLKAHIEDINAKISDVDKLFNNGLNSILSKLTEDQQADMLRRIAGWDPKLIDDLATRLGKEGYPGLADDLANPLVFNLYEMVAKDPFNAKNILEKPIWLTRI